MDHSASLTNPIVAWIGLDWADQKHDVCLQATGSTEVEHLVVEQKPEALQAWVAELRRRFPHGPIAIALEQSRGSLFYALMNYEFLRLYPIPPKALADYRKALYPSGSKDDPVDAQLLLEFLRKHPQRFRPWMADDVQTRQLALLNEHRRRLVDDRTALTNRLTTLLKGYFPEALGWAEDLRTPLAWDFLAQFPTLELAQQASRLDVLKVYRAHTRRPPEQLEALCDEIRTARPLTTDRAIIASSVLMVEILVEQLRVLGAGIERVEHQLADVFATHPDRAIFQSFPGAGKALAPRLLAAWGSDRQRFQDAANMQCFAGPAPVTVRSGKSKWVHRRFACPTFVCQTFHEFAAQSRLKSPWAKAYYQQMRSKGADHHPAVRALAFKWIRIMFRCWQDRTLYDELHYQQALTRRGSPLATELNRLTA
ncbi:MAG: IS110 family transposase [Terriglobia bacterium]